MQVPRTNGFRAALIVLLSGACWAHAPADAQEPTDPKAAQPVIYTEQDLPRVPVPRGGVLPWRLPGKDTAGKQKKPKETEDTSAAAGMMDVGGGDVIMRAYGTFSRKTKEILEVSKRDMVEKEIFSLRKDVEIEQPKTGSVLRGQHIQVIRDLKSGNVEKLEATGQVEIVMSGQSAKGETLTYETQFDEHGKLAKHVIVVDGDRDEEKPATLWSGEDAIQAFRFVMDLRMDTFRAMGGALAEVRLPADPNAVPKAPAAQPAGASMVPSLSLSAGVPVTIACDGDMMYESFNGRLHLKRNILIRQGSLKMWADELILQLQHETTSDKAGGTSGVFTGKPELIECKGRIEIITSGQTLHCDRLIYNLISNTARLESKSKTGDIKVYTHDPARPGGKFANQVIKVLGYMEIDAKSSNMRPGGRQRLVTFMGPIPELRPRRLPKLLDRGAKKDETSKGK